jgi:putative transcriptional regulator
MTPHHHVSGELLTAYAAGTAPEAIALFVASHASLCAACRARLAAEEAVGGALLGAIAPAPLDDLLARTLARLDEPFAPAPAPPPRHAVLPPPVMRLLGGEPTWRRVVPDLEIAELPVRLNGNPAVLTRLAAGSVVPPHTHAGWELQLVLSGGYQADDGRFDRGDAHCADPSVTHGFRVDADAPCVSLLVREARIVPKTLLGRVFCWFTGA